MRIGVLLFLLTLLMMSLAAEATVRLYALDPVAERHGQPYSTCYIWDQYTHHRPEPQCSAKKKPFRDDEGIPEVVIGYNAFGLRGPKIETKQEPRVLLLGDSFIEADEMVFEETMGEVLNRSISDYEFVQQGSTSWSPITEFDWMYTYGMDLEIDKIYLFVTDNDFMTAATYAQSDGAYKRMRFPRWLCKSRLMCMALSVLAAQRGDGSQGDTMMSVPSSLRTYVRVPRLARELVERLMLRLDPSVWEPNLRKSVRSTAQSIAAFAGWASEQGMSLTVVYIPLGIDIDDSESTGIRSLFHLKEGEYFLCSGLEEWLRDTLHREKIDFVSLLNPLREGKQAKEPAGKNVLYYKYDGHFTPTTHRLVAKVIASHLQRGKMRIRTDETSCASREKDWFEVFVPKVDFLQLVSGKGAASLYALY